MTFNEKMNRLEAIAAALENADVDLEASLQYYEEGMKLVGECEKVLENTKQKVMILTEEGTAVPFEEEENEDEFII